MSEPTSKISPAVDVMSEVNPSANRPGYLPNLALREWITFAILAAALALTNIYTTLVTGWGDGGSLIAVVGAVMILSLFPRRSHIQALNLGQTMASAGGTVGFAVTSYAAVKIAFPDFEVNPYLLVLFYVGMGFVGTVIGSSVRKQMVKYYFPSGTACAVIQRTVTDRGGEAAKRPVRLLALWGSIGAAIAIPTKIAFSKGASALISKLTITKTIAISVDPVFYGIGIVVGPRVGLGMLIGGVASSELMPQLLEGNVAPAHFGDWIKWSAIALLTLPTFATLLFALLFRTLPIVPPGFRPGATNYVEPSRRALVYAAFAIVGLALTAFTAQAMFDLEWYLTIIVVGLCWPLAIMNGRVTGETDINPVRLVIIVILTLLALAMSATVVMLIGMALIASMLAGMAVDMMQDYRTGFLVDANPTHQTSVQFIGVLIGAAVAVPFMLFLDSSMGFGAGTQLPAPGPQIYATMAKAFAGGAYMTQGLVIALIAISIVGSAYAFFTVWPRTARWMPSLFGAGIAMLLPLEASIAIFLGGMIKWTVMLASTRDKTGEAREQAANQSSDDTMLVGSALFASSAIMTVILIAIIELTGLFYLGH